MAEARECLVVADSQVIVRHVLSDYLRHCGYRVIDAANSDEVLEILRNRAADVTVVLADAELAGSLNVFDLAQRVRRDWPSIDFVMAGNVAAAARLAGDLCEEGPHLRRPYEPEAVVAHIRRLRAAAAD